MDGIGAPALNGELRFDPAAIADGGWLRRLVSARQRIDDTTGADTLDTRRPGLQIRFDAEDE